MTWPATHCCHWRTRDPIPGCGGWRAPQDSYNAETGDLRYVPWRTCDYCGSIHPMDLLELLRTVNFPGPSTTTNTSDGPSIELADMKYGWPHKFYVNPRKLYEPEREFTYAGTIAYKGGERIMNLVTRKGWIPWAKFYAEHLFEPDASAEHFAALTHALYKVTWVRYTRDPDGRLKWQIERP